MAGFSTPRSILTGAKARFLQIADDFTWLNPHLSLTVDWLDERAIAVEASDPSWRKWKPSDPTCPHWYPELPWHDAVNRIAKGIQQ